MSIADLLIAIKELQLNKIYAPAVLTKKYLEESVFAQAEAIFEMACMRIGSPADHPCRAF